MIRLLLTVIVLLGLAFFGRRLEGSWVGAGTFYAVIWASYLALTSFFVVDYEVFRAATLVLIGGCAAVMAGSLGTAMILESRIATRPSAPVFPWLRAVALVVSLLALGEVYIIFARAGFSLRALASYAVIAQISVANRSTFGYGDQQQSMVERALYVFVYAAPLFGGTLLAVARHSFDRILGVATLAVCWLVPTLYGSRMGALFGGSFWIASYLATKVATVGVTQSGRLLARVAAGAGIAVFGVSLLAMIIRYQAGASPTLTKMVSDPFGFVTAFAYWVQDGGLWQSEGLLWGQRTFERLLSPFMTIPERPGAIDVGFTTSNIFTIYRSLVEDFGPLGAILALVGLGAAGQWSLRRAAAGHQVAVAMLATVYATMFVSFSLSLFMYGSTTAAIVVYFGYCAWSSLQTGGVRPLTEVPS